MSGKHGTDPELVVNVSVYTTNLGYTSNNAHRTGYFTAHLTFTLQNGNTVKRNVEITGITLTSTERIEHFTIGKYDVKVKITALTSGNSAPQMVILGVSAQIIETNPIR